MCLSNRFFNGISQLLCCCHRVQNLLPIVPVSTPIVGADDLLEVDLRCLAPFCVRFKPLNPLLNVRDAFRLWRQGSIA